MSFENKSDYYSKKYERIVNRFIWNIPIYASLPDCYEGCYREAIEEIEKVYQEAIRRKDMIPTLRNWALNTIERYYVTYKQEVS